MALEAAFFQQDLLSYGHCMDIHAVGGAECWSYGFGFEQDKVRSETFDRSAKQGFNENWEYSSPSSMVQNVKEWDANSSSPENICNGDGFFAGGLLQTIEAPAAASGRRKRRRTKTCKNKEEIENQRMTHIAVERNRRKQMNDYLAALRALMPPSYVQRGDQASIIGSAINYVKGLEQLFQTLEAQKRLKQRSEKGPSSSSLSNFFTFPQYSTCSTKCNNSVTASEPMTEKWSSIADVEVTVVESHANLKVLTGRRPRQLLKMVAGFHCLRLTVLHLNVTTVDQMVLYSFSVKIEDDCELNTVNDIAAAVYEMVGRIQEEAKFC